MRMKQTKKPLRMARRHRLALALAGAMAMPMAPAFTQTLPWGGSVVPGSGSATIGTSGNTMTVTQTTKGAIINWAEFSIGTGYGVHFDHQFGSDAVTLNRVVGFGYGPGFSEIYGSLTSVGTVFIINPAGVVFGEGAQVNVGSLVASTLDISDAAFLSGVNSGHYVFQPGSGDSNAITNLGTITTSNGGTAAFVSAVLNNQGTINAPGGSVVFGSGQQVTLDFFGDGLTQVTVAGPALYDLPSPSCEFNCTPVSGAAQNRGTISADGGQILMHVSAAPGAVGILNMGTMRARGMANRAGRIELVATGGMVMHGSLTIDDGPAVIDVNGGTGTGGTVLLSGTDVYIGGGYNAAPSEIDASGGAGGGQVRIVADQLLYLPPGANIHANAINSGNGGLIELSAGDSLVAWGNLSARGVASGGSILTRTGGTFDIRGLGIDAGAAGAAGTWTLSAPSILVLSGSEVGEEGGADLDNYVQDADINSTLNNGTNVTLQAGVAPGDSGWVAFQDGVDIFYDDGTVPLEFRVDAGGSIWGDNFSIASNGAPLTMVFNADANGSNTGFAGIDFTGANLESSGGDILFYGQSDAANGAATNFSTGVRISESTIITSGGDVLIRGASTGADAGYADAGVVLFDTTIDAGDGGILIQGSADRYVSGVIIEGGDLLAGSGGLAVEGTSEADDLGVYGLSIRYTRIEVDGGDVALSGISGNIGTLINADVHSNGGDISLHGEGGVGEGIAIFGIVDSGGGDISVTGSSAGAEGVRIGICADGCLPAGLYSGGGDIAIEGDGATFGVVMQVADAIEPGNVGMIASGGGGIDIIGNATAAGGIGVYSAGVDLVAGAGDVTVEGSAPLGTGILFAYGAGVSTTSGAITLDGTGADFGLDLTGDAIDTESGDITLIGDALAATATAGVRVAGDGLATSGGTITVTGTSAGGAGVQLGDGSQPFAVESGGGDIRISGEGVVAGVWMQDNEVDGGGGDIDIRGTASGAGGVGVDLAGSRLVGAAGDVTVFGSAVAGSGVSFTGGSAITTTTGGISLTGIGEDVGLAILGELSTDSGHFDLRGLGTGAASSGLVIGPGVSIATNGGGIELSGQGGSGAGLELGAGSSVDAGNSLVVLRAGNDSSSDAIRLGGTVSSTLGVNLRPGGVDANGGLTERTGDEILFGSGTGFALDSSELARIQAPRLVVGSNLHAGAIRVHEGIAWDGDLTLQNDGGSGGIELQAAIDVGDGTLGLSSGGDIVQGSSGAITAHSLLARAGGDVLLAAAQNNVAANTLAGSAGGRFEYQDVDALAIGSVSTLGMDASSNGLAGISLSGISAGGDVFVRNLAGDLVLNAGVSGADIDLVTANTLQNLAGAQIVASGNWRIWANTWEGETRGGLAGSGDLPNLYGCVYLGACGVTVSGTDNHFIYVQQPVATVSFDDFSREYGLPNPVFTFTVTGAILGDSPAAVATGDAVTSATIGSDVGNYEITGNFTSAAGYQIVFNPGTLAITPATLLFTADPVVRYLGTPNPVFTGEVAGFRNGDTLQSVFGSDVVWWSTAGLLSPVGYYPINGGTSAKNYVFAQAPGNATALQIIPLPQLSSTPIDLVRETVDTYVYDSNLGNAPVCAVNATLDDQPLLASGDLLSSEWGKVRSRPNLTNCFDSERRSACGDF